MYEQNKEQDRGGIFGEQSHAGSRAERQPPSYPPGLPRTEIAKTCGRPDRHLRDVMIELRRWNRKIVHASKKKCSYGSPGAAQDVASKFEDENVRCRNAQLAQEKRTDVAKDIEKHLHRPRRQRRMFVIAPLPFVAPGETVADDVERQASREQPRQHGPQNQLRDNEKPEPVAKIRAAI